MSEFVITELDDRYEFGMAILDDDALRGYDNETKCTNSGNCCGTNQPGACTDGNCGSACCKS